MNFYFYFWSLNNGGKNPAYTNHYNICYSTTILTRVSLGILTYGEIAYLKGMWRFQGEYWLHGITGSLIHRPDGCAKLIAPVMAKHLSMAATAGVIWLCTCVKKWPYRGFGICALVLKLVLVRLGLFKVLRVWKMSSVNRGKINIKRVKLVTIIWRKRQNT